jgi:hypothetical protein
MLSHEPKAGSKESGVRSGELGFFREELRKSSDRGSGNLLLWKKYFIGLKGCKLGISPYLWFLCIINFLIDVGSWKMKDLWRQALQLNTKVCQQRRMHQVQKLLTMILKTWSSGPSSLTTKSIMSRTIHKVCAQITWL